MRVEGDIVVGVVVMVVVVSVVGMRSSTVSSSVVSACAANVMYSLETRFDRDSGREAPSTLRRARAPLRGRAGHRACGQRPRGRAVAASAGSGQALQSVKRNASGTRNFRVAPRLLPVSVVRGYCWRPSQK